jgi:glycerophosphoryl diester phosphodiesterase
MNYNLTSKQLSILILTLCSVLTLTAHSKKEFNKSLLVVQSNSFNAKKKSNFLLNDIKEQVDRGLTVVHFLNDNKFEFRTFDTHGSVEAVTELKTLLPKLLKEKAVFVILAHDSAAKAFQGNTSFLYEIGLTKLSALESRQAYIMHNLEGEIVEQVDDLSLMLRKEVSKTVVNNTIYFPKEVYTFEPHINRYIAHAGGEVNGIKSTNTKDALDESYAKGFRFFELDIIKTSDGKLVAAHDWKMWSRFTDYKGELPPTHEEFMKRKIYGDYTTLDLEGINDWFKAHPDATLVTDKLNDPIAFSNAFVDKERLIMELFSVMKTEEAASEGLHAMISQQPFMSIKGDKLDFLKINNVKYVALSRRMIKREKELLKLLRDEGIKVYVYHVNFDEGKDEKYVYDNEIGLVYGMYADKWAFGAKPKE